MSELTLLVLRIGFLGLLWFFIFAVVYALRSDLFGVPVRRMRNDGAAPRPQTFTPQQTPVTAPPGHLTSPATPIITPSGGAFPSAAATPGQTAPQATTTLSPSANSARHLVITSGVAAGTSIPLDEDFVTIGRSSESTLIILDEYTSTHHARLTRSDGQWTLADLDSTNGTRMNGTRVTRPVAVPLYTPITIGTTTFELRP
jgi:hypothetical protein